MIGEASVRDWLRILDARELSARELVERTIRRLEAADRTLNAIVAIEPERALANAEEADRRRAGGDHSPLLGIPITVKDAIDAAGWPTAYGSFGSRSAPAPKSATAVERLERAGAVVVAKTNLPECSSASETDNARFGRTNNPWDAQRTPGGSSGGEAALLGADASIVGVGTDGGCSIRLPSHYCGIAGIRPTAGRVPETGLRPGTRASGMLDMSCIGPMARHVEDLEILLPIMSGADLVDPFAPPMPTPVPAPIDLKLRVGYYSADSTCEASAATVGAVREAAAAIGPAEEIEPPDSAAATQLFFDCIAADGGAHIKRAVKDGGPFTPQFADLLQNILPPEPPPADEAFSVLERLFAMRAATRAFASNHDVIVCPVAPTAAPLHGQTQYDWLNFPSPYSIAGLPVAVVRAGEEAGLPVGVQIIAAPFREDLALLAAKRVESALGGYRPAPLSLPG